MSFLGQVLTFQVFYPNLSRAISERVDVTVGDGTELGDIAQYDLRLPGTRVVNADIDLAAASIRYTIDEPGGLFAVTPGFNGYVFSDTNDTVNPIIGVSIVSGSNTLALTADSVFFSENAIFVDVDGLSFARGDIFELVVSFGAGDMPSQGIPFEVQAIARLYEACFGRVPDDPGLNFWIDVGQSGTDLTTIARSFLGSDEFQQRFGAIASLSDRALVDVCYQNILDRPGEAAGIDYWLGQLASGQVSRPHLLLLFATSAENVAATGYVDDMARNMSGTEWFIA